MKHSIALVTGATSGLGHVAAHLIVGEGYREVIVTERSVTRMLEMAAQPEAETKTRVFTPMERDLNAPHIVQSPLVNGHHQLTVELLHSANN
ncbi:short chain dehydrogenase [Bryocella elongata]|uniref:Short chain dehydrogenase n=1 Tax=Bryocella elongata TaxID=863522 RepID=A0A1H6CGA5_9BACT|nr:SDR family NAD(P)-dependent oxidoreductase [Bryocella elongata]SEG71833.1 short chain dehydrogenase [Bryocella elongata]